MSLQKNKPTLLYHSCSTFSWSPKKASSFNGMSLSESSSNNRSHESLVSSNDRNGSKTNIEVQLVFSNGLTKNVKINEKDRIDVLHQHTSPGAYFVHGDKFLYDDYRFQAFEIKSGDKIRVIPNDSLPTPSEYCAMVKIESQKINLDQYKMMQPA